MRRLAASALLSSLLLAAVPSAQSTVIPPPLSSDQEKRLSAMSPDEQIYERFRYWAGFQPPDVQDDALRYYDAYLASRGVPADDRARSLRQQRAPQLFPGLHVLRYEDVEAKPDFGSGPVRVVRFCAMKE